MIEIMTCSEKVKPVGNTVMREVCELMTNKEPGTILKIICKGMSTNEKRALGNNISTRLKDYDIRSKYIHVDNAIYIFHRGYLGNNVFEVE